MATENGLNQSGTTARILIRKRGKVRGNTTRVLNSTENELQREEPDIEILEVNLDQLTRFEKALNTLNNQIEALITEEDDLESEWEIAENYNSEITAAKGRIQRKLECSRTAALREVNGNRTDIPPLMNPHYTALQARNVPNVRLPKLEIRKFDGTIAAWQTFWTQYETAIHNNENLHDSDKFNYLISYLEGNAATAIRGLNSNNYEYAITTLRNRFGERGAIVSTHLNNFFDLPPIKNSNDVSGLRKFYDFCETQIRSLKSMNVDINQDSIILSCLIYKRLPSDIALGFSRLFESEADWKVHLLLEYLLKEITSRERAHAILHADEKTPTKPLYKAVERNSFPRNDHRPKSFPSSTASLTTGTVERLVCLFCDSHAHSTTNCPKSSEERKEILANLKRCFICLKEGHQARDCRSKYQKCRNCSRKHHKVLCDRKELREAQNVNTEPKTRSETTADMTSGIQGINGNLVLLQTAKALISSPSGDTTMKIRCLLDNGAQRTYIQEDISKNLQLPVIGFEELDSYHFSSDKPTRVKRNKVRLTLMNVQFPAKTITLEALEIPHISGNVFPAPDENTIQLMTEKGLMIADAPTGNPRAKNSTAIELLIGSDYYWEIVTTKIFRLSDTLVAMETIFGWTVNGPTKVKSSAVGINTVAVMFSSSLDANEESTLSEKIQAFWNLDSIGIREDGTKPNLEDDQVLKDFEKTIAIKEGRYQVSFPWNENKPQLKDNLAVATKRTENLINRLKANPIRFQEYHNVILNQIEAKVVEEVDATQDKPSDVIYYLPHREIIREDHESTRIRVVHDASSRAKGALSLNNCLESGPNLNPELFDVLIRFREYRIVFTSDIEKAFLQISIQEDDRNAIRFLWVQGDTEPHPAKSQHYRITRVPFGVTCSPFLLAATVRHHLRKFEETHPEACHTINQQLYVDDLLSGGHEVLDAFQLSHDTKEILSQASMNLRKWKTNSAELQKLWIESGITTEDEQNQATPNSKVLGLIWNYKQDCIIYDLTSLLQLLVSRDNTKRWVLKTVTRIFDPLGFLAPYTIRAKFLFQLLWERGVSWDEPLPDDISILYDDWCNELTELRNLTIPRFYFSGIENSPVTSAELHIFVDASQKAYAATAYLRYQTTDHKIGTTLVASKTRVAPLQKLTLPRLELMGAVLGARLSKHLMEALSSKPTKLRMWTDSTISLQWIRGAAATYKPFVSNRVREIQTLTSPEIWSHCKGKDNPADLPTRGLKASNLLTNAMWWRGPIWLSEPGEFPISNPKPDDALNSEIKREFRATIFQGVSVAVANPEQPFQLKDYSSLSRVYRLTAWISRFIHNSRKPNHRLSGPLSADEIHNAEIKWVKITQRESYPHEVRSLSSGQAIDRKSTILSLDPFLDADGILSVGGRLTGTTLTYRERHPWIMPYDHTLSRLLVQFHHHRLMHAGVNDTLVEIREKFWIVRGRQLIKNQISKCVICFKYRARPSAAPMAPLPPLRNTPAPAFEITGLDFAGPLYTKKGNKTYIALFTCAVTRAVHFELVTDLTTEKFLMAFSRFIARRGIVKTVFSDNAKTFKRADLDLKAIFQNLRSSEVTSYLGEHRITWKFIADRAAWWGGFYERLVRSCKTALKKTIGKAKLTAEELQTILTEAEATINSRPLTFLYEDPGEPIVLTPAHFLVGRRITTLPSRSFPQTEVAPVTRDALVKRYKYRQTLNDRFWTRWKDDYLLELRSAHHRTRCNPTKELKPNDLVLIKEEKIPRQCWKTAIVTEAFRGRDGVIRSCLLRTANGTICKRPVQLLYLLEFQP